MIKYKLKNIQGLYAIRDDSSISFEEFNIRLNAGEYIYVGNRNNISRGMIDLIVGTVIDFKGNTETNIGGKNYYTAWCDILPVKATKGGKIL